MFHIKAKFYSCLLEENIRKLSLYHIKDSIELGVNIREIMITLVCANKYKSLQWIIESNLWTSCYMNINFMNLLCMSGTEESITFVKWFFTNVASWRQCDDNIEIYLVTCCNNNNINMIKYILDHAFNIKSYDIIKYLYNNLYLTVKKYIIDSDVMIRIQKEYKIKQERIKTIMKHRNIIDFL